jgi:hypothetical protein
MAKNTQKMSGNAKIVLSCVYSGFKGEPGPGDTIEVSADEAERLVSIGAAKKAD